MLTEGTLSEGRNALLCFFQKEIPSAKKILMNIDRNIFSLLSDMQAVLGKDFSPRVKNDVGFLSEIDTFFAIRKNQG